MVNDAMAKLVLKRSRLDKRIADLSRERDAVLEEMAAESGFTPCADCVGGWCSMNCSSAPGYLKVLS